MKLNVLSSKRKQGFGTPTQSIDQYTKSFLKHSRFFNHSAVLSKQKQWFYDFTSRRHEYSLDELLQCEHHDLSMDFNPGIVFPRTTSHHHVPVLNARNGFWGIMISKDMINEINEFTINVNVGGIYMLHPVAIKNDISRKYGAIIYNKWRSMVLDDLQALKRLVEIVRQEIDFIAPSIVTCPSSRRLCERVGIPVKQDVAFLFPSAYS